MEYDTYDIFGTDREGVWQDVFLRVQDCVGMRELSVNMLLIDLQYFRFNGHSKSGRYHILHPFPIEFPPLLFC